ncbi:MAG: AmmeMemoRadiSam system protein A [Verrucomicrobia bacterium]|nr:AmmeMemoRadiSam system protein A [Verrucomicrobiota bacterium]
MSSQQNRQGYTPGEQQLLIDMAHDSIRHGVLRGTELKVHCENFPERLRDPRATFVTLEIDGRLRGCIGSLEAYRPLIEDVAANAYSAAFRDPRFPTMTPEEAEKLDIHISILSPPEPIKFSDENDLLKKLRPGIDGLILAEGVQRGTFLPSVWKQLPDPATFLQHLKLKAGLPADYWSGTVTVERYTAEYIPSGND